MNDLPYNPPVLESGALVPGFGDPAAGAQACFRAILTALSAPGQIVELPPRLAAPAAILLTLTDPTTRVCLPASADALRSWLGFHTGAAPATMEEADFALAAAPPPLTSLQAGTDEAPEHGATLILDLPGFGTGRHYRLTGPGIETSTMLHVPLDAGFAADWQANAARAPRGIDILLCARRQIIGLPRSIAIEEI